jgi:hypothetical protein
VRRQPAGDGAFCGGCEKAVSRLACHRTPDFLCDAADGKDFKVDAALTEQRSPGGLRSVATVWGKRGDDTASAFDFQTFDL